MATRPPAGPSPARPQGRPLAQALVVFLLAVVLGRLLLEPSGLGRTLLVFFIPLAAVVLAALFGWRAGLVLLAVVLALAVGVRGLLLFSGGWLLVLLTPMAVAVLVMSVHVVRAMLREARGRHASDEEE